MLESLTILLRLPYTFLNSVYLNLLLFILFYVWNNELIKKGSCYLKNKENFSEKMILTFIWINKRLIFIFRDFRKWRMQLITINNLLIAFFDLSLYITKLFSLQKVQTIDFNLQVNYLKRILTTVVPLNHDLLSCPSDCQAINTAMAWKRHDYL